MFSTVRLENKPSFERFVLCVFVSSKNHLYLLCRFNLTYGGSVSNAGKLVMRRISHYFSHFIVLREKRLSMFMLVFYISSVLFLLLFSFIVDSYKP